MTNTVEFIKIWQVSETMDEYSRRGSVLGYFSTEFSARQYSLGKGWWGGTGLVEEKTGIVVEGKVYVLERASPIDLDGKQKEYDEKLRKKALGKLTEEEIRVLKIKVE